MEIGENTRMQSELENKMQKAVDENRKWLAKQEKCLALIKEGGEASIKVYVRSLWEDEGGISTTYEAEGSLAEAVRDGIEDFRCRNGFGGKGGDIQAIVSVSLVVGGISLSVPEKYFKRYVKAATKPLPVKGKKQTK